MGYSAEIIHNEGRDDGLLALIEPRRYGAVWTALQAAETGIGHISWCDTLDKYTEDDEGERIAHVLRDFGFDGCDAEEDGIHVAYWGGDKLGSSWDDVVGAIALGVDPDEKLIWYLTGEDSLNWAVVIHHGEAYDAEVEMTVKER